jgi:hypothetical protein
VLQQETIGRERKYLVKAGLGRPTALRNAFGSRLAHPASEKG